MSALALAAVGGTGREAGLLVSLLAYLKTSRTNPFLSDESKVLCRRGGAQRVDIRSTLSLIHI